MVDWTFITNHGAVLVVIYNNQQITAREIARQLGITERSVQRIIRDLEEAGYIEKIKEGRMNRYAVNPERLLRRDDLRGASIGDLLAILSVGN